MCEHRSHPRGVDRRGLMRAGAGITTVAALARFEPAAAGESSTQTFEGTFTGVGTPDWHYLPVEVPKGVREIEVAYTAPETNTGLGFSVNVVDIGMFDPSGHDLGNAEGFRGWSGGARDGFSISRTAATPGYLAGPMAPGVWHVILGPVAIVPPGVDWSVTVTLHFGEPERKFRPNPAPRSVPGTGPGWYRGDLHLHTVHSDGRHTQPSLVAEAQAAGLDFLVSTEHNTSSATYTWGEHTPEDFLVVNGEEITTRGGHWLAVGLPAGAWIDWRYRPEDGELQRFTDQVRGLGGIAIAAHPFVPIPMTKWDFGYDFAGMDAFEIWNGPWTLDDQFGVEHWHAMLVAGKFVPAVGSSDSHHSGQQVGRAQTVVHTTDLSTGAVVEGLRSGRSWVAESSAVDLDFTARLRDRVVSCGERLDAGPLDQVTVRLTVRCEPGNLAQIHGPLAPLAGGIVDDSGEITLEATVPAATTRFVRAEVRRPTGEVPSPLEGAPGATMVALTNPIFL